MEKDDYKPSPEFYAAMDKALEIVSQKKKEPEYWKAMEKPVTKEEFDEFIANYPNKLSRDVAKMIEPPMLSYNDFSNGKVWPESVVCWAILNELTHGLGKPEDDKPNEYFIKQ